MAEALSPSASLHPDVPAFRTEDLPVPGGHRLRVTQHGNPRGIPALVLHGGPGTGCSPLMRRFFDPARYHMICIDQRGAGASHPAGATANNTTADLLADLRRLRAHLVIERWLAVGGSWGATLAVAHAADQPEAVSGLLLRSVFLARRADIAAFFRRSTAPNPAAASAWDALAALLPNGARDDLLPALADRLDPADGGDAGEGGAGSVQRALASAWWAWEQALVDGAVPGAVPDGATLEALVRCYRVQSHYLRHGCWLQSPSLLERAKHVPAVPMLLLHGTADRVCPPAGASALHRALPDSRLNWVSDAGHDPTHPAMVAAMLAALGRYADCGRLADVAGPATGATACRCV